MHPPKRLLLLLLGSVIAATTALPAIAQNSDVTQANNPLANLKTLTLENRYAPTLSDGVPGSTNSFRLRYRHPIGGFLLETTLPVNRVPSGLLADDSGLGDLRVFAAYLFDLGNAGRSLGIGPVMTAPSASEDSLGAGRWQAGVAGAYFDDTSEVVQWGGVVSWQTDFAGDDARADTHALEARPFIFLQLGNSLYARSAPIWAFDIESGTHSLPLSLGLGKVIRAGSVVYNVFVEPQFSILDDGPGQPEFQLLMGLNLQFN